MRLGAGIYWRGATIEGSRKIALESDKVGLDYLWVTEAWGLEALSTIGYLAGITGRVKIGPGVLNAFSRSAALIGMFCATMNQLAPRRFMVGLGTSGKTLIEEFHGIPFDKPIRRTREYVEVIRKVSRGERIDYKGRVLKLSRFKIATDPMRADPEIYIGAIGDRNLALAGEIADGAIVTLYPFSKLSRAVSQVSLGAQKSAMEEEETKARPKPVFAQFPVIITSSTEETRQTRKSVAKQIAFYVASMGEYYARNLSNLGYEDQVKKIVHAHASSREAALDAVDDKLLDDLSMVGDAEEVAGHLGRLPPRVIPVLGLDASNPSLSCSTIAALGQLLKGS
jgi:alkanesulfonate monooxygenase SsuD/methylene tetrahydromethanopterin reductase-like flavin-dependent oxidoreductase (luciferase family)